MACLLNTPEAIAAYHKAGEELALLKQLTEWREAAGLTKAQVAARMGVTPPAITRLERNVTRASWLTLKRYAAACGVDIRLTARREGKTGKARLKTGIHAKAVEINLALRRAVSLGKRGVGRHMPVNGHIRAYRHIHPVAVLIA